MNLRKSNEDLREKVMGAKTFCRRCTAASGMPTTQENRL
jgi:hypothetical protein